MKTFTFYRLQYFNVNTSPRGYAWFTSRASAQQGATAWQRSTKDDDEYDPDYTDFRRTADLAIITVTPTKAGILDALNLHASDDVTEA
jgi:hypothetical protein